MFFLFIAVIYDVAEVTHSFFEKVQLKGSGCVSVALDRCHCQGCCPSHADQKPPSDPEEQKHNTPSEI